MARDAITISEAGLRLGQSYPVVLRRVMVGEIPGWREAGRWRVDGPAVERLAEERKAASDRAGAATLA